MEFRTLVEVPKMGFEIQPCEALLFVGSCFADAIGQRFREEGFPVVVNPHGTMYNPVSILHTIERLPSSPSAGKDFSRIVFLTLGTNHVYRLKETGEIVDNCQKRPQSLFLEEELSVDECTAYLAQTVEMLRERNSEVHVVLTVSPIRYRKYGYHESQLSKATLLLSVRELISRSSSPHSSFPVSHLHYFPAYEIVLDELRDYRFYAEDMLHPSRQAVDYIWERLSETCLSAEAKSFLREWQPLRQALAHKPFAPDSEEYRQFKEKTMLKVMELQKKYPTFAL